mgnify:CR=1 FL=1
MSRFLLDLLLKELSLTNCYLVSKWRSGSSTTAKGAIVLVGPSLGGKTALFYRLVCNQFRASVLSMDVNRGTTPLDGGARTVIDCPGMDRLRRMKDPFLSDAAVIVFVVDGQMPAQKIARESAETLADILTSAAGQKLATKKIQFILAFSRADQPLEADFEQVLRYLSQVCFHYPFILPRNLFSYKDSIFFWLANANEFMLSCYSVM